MQQPVYQNPNTQSPEKVYNQNIILWAAMLVSQFLFLVLIYFTKPELYNVNAVINSPVEISTVVAILFVVGAVIFAVSFVLKARFLRLAVRDKKVETVQSGYIVAYALCEAVSLFGLLSAFAFNFRYFFAFFALGILGFLLHYPRRAAFQAAAFTGINLND